METTDWTKMADKLQRLGGPHLRQAFRAGTKEATDILHAEAKQLLNKEIYSIPEDRTGSSYKRDKTSSDGYAKTGEGKRIRQRRKISDTEASLSGQETGTKAGKKKWTRTGNLRRAEQRRVNSEIEGLVWNDVGYATARHNLGLSPGDPAIAPPPPSKKRNSWRIAPWRTKAITNTNLKRLEAYRKALFDALQD